MFNVDQKNSSISDVISHVVDCKNSLTTSEAVSTFNEITQKIKFYNYYELRDFLSKNFKAIKILHKKSIGAVSVKEVGSFYSSCKRITADKSFQPRNEKVAKLMNRMNDSADQMLTWQTLKFVDTEHLVQIFHQLADGKESELKVSRNLVASECLNRSDYTPEQMTSLCYACAKNSYDDERLFGHLARLAVLQKEQFNVVQIAYTLWSFANLGISNPALFENFANEVMKIEYITTKSATLMMWSLCVFKPNFSLAPILNHLLHQIDVRELDNFSLVQLRQVRLAAAALKIHGQIRWPKGMTEAFKKHPFGPDEKKSKTQEKVEGILKRIFPSDEWQDEYFFQEVFWIDIFSKTRNLAVEVDGPFHFIPGSGRYYGSNHMKDWILRELGIALVRINFQEIDNRSMIKIGHVLKEKIQRELKEIASVRKKLIEDRRRNLEMSKTKQVEIGETETAPVELPKLAEKTLEKNFVGIEETSSEQKVETDLCKSNPEIKAVQEMDVAIDQNEEIKVEEKLIAKVEILEEKLENRPQTRKAKRKSGAQKRHRAKLLKSTNNDGFVSIIRRIATPTSLLLTGAAFSAAAFAVTYFSSFAND